MPTTPGSRSTRSTSTTAALHRPLTAATTLPVDADVRAGRAASRSPRQLATPALDVMLTTVEVARELRVDVRTVRRYIDAGDLPAYRFGRGYRVRRAQLDQWLAGCRA